MHNNAHNAAQRTAANVQADCVLLADWAKLLGVLSYADVVWVDSAGMAALAEAMQRPVQNITLN